MITIRFLDGDYQFPATALIKPRVVLREKNLFKWKAAIIIDDEKIYLEAESFYHDRLPQVWHDTDENIFVKIARTDIFPEWPE